MMQQYHAIKSECPGALLFFRLGDFYELFGPDALEASKILDITLTARNKSKDPIPMCGVPYHAAESYIAKLTKAGKKVAICEQISDPSLPGIVKRKITKIITPGTTFSDQVLDKKQSRYILALYPQKDYFGLAFADLTTGEFLSAQIQGRETLKSELIRLNPAEIVLSRDHYNDPDIRTLIISLTKAPISPADLYEEGYKFLLESFNVTGLEGFGIASKPFAIQAAAVLMRYLKDTQKEDINHLDRITAYYRENWMELDESTIRNLELFGSLIGNSEQGTLISILDETLTSVGGRTLRRWITCPLLKSEEITARHEAVEELLQNSDLRADLVEELKNLRDLERLLGRLSSNSASPRDLIGLGLSLKIIPKIKNLLANATSNCLRSLQNQLIELPQLTAKISNAILEEPSLRLHEGGIVAPGFSTELDELHSLMKAGRTALKNIEEKERKDTGISSLKVSYNKVFGYYIEVSNANRDRVPDYFIRKQTLVNAERYITPELKEYEEKVLTAREKANQLEYEIFQEIRALTLEYVKDIKLSAQTLGELDALLSFAIVAERRSYVRPTLSKEHQLEIEEGRHPVVESMTFEQKFIPNPANFNANETEILLLTGPNMSGKSTYLRQIALIALLNQIGSFVPARAATLPVFDRIFTRVGASDNLVRGQSTFMVEMQESAYILNHATARSLIILDEVGRGTSTYDGLSLAWAILEFLHEKTRAFTLFATHYHELIGLADRLPRAKNYSIDVKETAKGVLFLHRIVEGPIDRSYGIEVARIAGMPPDLVQRANEILQELETKKIQSASIPESQMNLFNSSFKAARTPGYLTHPALEKLKGIDINELTPLEALQTLNELKLLRE